jgi:hypothetical protein
VTYFDPNLGNHVYQQLNFSNIGSSQILGEIIVNFNYEFFEDFNQTPTGFENDLYSAGLHEVLHLLGFNARFPITNGVLITNPMNYITPLNPLLYVIPNDIPLYNGVDFNTDPVVNSNLENSNCTPSGPSVIARTCNKDIPFDLTFPGHLRRNCNGTLESYVMGFDLLQGSRTVRAPHQDEVNILIRMGYNVANHFGIVGENNYRVYQNNDDVSIQIANDDNAVLPFNAALCGNIEYKSICIDNVLQPVDINLNDLMINDINVSSINNLTVTDNSGTLEQIDGSSIFKFTPCLFFNGRAILSYDVVTDNNTCLINTKNSALVYITVESCALSSINLVSTCNGNANNPVIVSPLGSNPLGLMISNPTVLNGSGTIDLITTTSFQFTPCPFFSGIAELSYEINSNTDPNCSTITNKINVNVDNCISNIPYISTCIGSVNQPVIINPIGSNPNAIINNINTINSFGTINLLPPNSFQFTPFPNFHGIATLSYDLIPSSPICPIFSKSVNVTVNKCSTASTNYDLSPCDFTMRGWTACGTNLDYNTASNPALLQLHENLPCNLVCNPEIYYDNLLTRTIKDESVICRNNLPEFPFYDRPTTENFIPGWREPLIGRNTADFWGAGISSDIVNTDGNGINGNIGLLDINEEEIEGTLQDRVVGRDYLFSVYLQNFTLEDASFHISLRTDRDDPSPINIFDDETFTSDQYQRHITRLNLSTIPDNRDLERIHFKIKKGNRGAYVTFDQVELVPDNFTAGPDRQTQCGTPVVLGTEICGDLSNTLYEWFIVGAGGVETSVRAPSLDPTFVVSPSTTTTYRVRRTFSTFENGLNNINPIVNIYENGGITTNNIIMQDDVRVLVFGQPNNLIANFSSTILNQCGNRYRFRAPLNPPGSTHTWQILFDGNIIATSNDNPFIFTFPYSGTFRVIHTITIDGCSISKPRNIFVNSSAPSSNFEITNIGCNQFSFQSNTGGQNINHVWTINDNGVITTFTTPNIPSISFPPSPSRTITVTHRITRNNNVCFSELIQSIDIIELNPNFEANFLSNCNEYNFIPSQDGIGFEHHWDFGDGTTSNLAQPTHQFASNLPNHPAITHTITYNGCTEMETNELDINLLDPLFTYAPSGLCNRYNFTPNDIIDIRHHHWDFGDGTASEVANPSHQFAELNVDKTYSVNHFIHELYNCNTSVSLSVFVPAIPDPSFTPTENETNCLINDFLSTETREEVVFNFGGVETPVDVEHTWLVDNVQESTDPNPSILFATPGWHTVTHIVKIADCERMESLRIFAGVDANFSGNKICNDGLTYNQINFISNTNQKEVTHSWNFGDGSPISDLANPLHTFPVGHGTYSVIHTVTAIGDEDCTHEIQHDVVIRNPDFTFMKSTTICNEYTFIPIAAPPIPALTHSWFAIGGTMGSNQNPQILSGGATYSIYHQINYSDGVNQYCVSVAKPETTVTFDASFTEQHTCNNYTFTSTPSTPLPVGTLHSWDFGDGSPVTAFSTNSSTSPSHPYDGSILSPIVKHTIRIDGCDYIFSLPINIAPNGSGPFNISGNWTTLGNSDNVNPTLFTDKQCIIPGVCGTPIQTSATMPNLFFRFQNPATKGFQLIFKYGIIDGINYGTIAAPTFKLYKYNTTTNALDLITQRNYTISDRLKISYYDDDPNAIFYVEASNGSTNYGSFTVCFSNVPGNDVIQGAFEITTNMISNDFNVLIPLNRSTTPITGLGLPNETDKFLTSFENKNADWYNTQIDGEQDGKNVWFKFLAKTPNIDIQQLNRNLNVGSDNTDPGNPRLSLFDWNDDGNNLIDVGEMVLLDSKLFNFEGIRVGYSGLTINKEYYISVSDFPGYEGNFTLRLFDIPSNDFIQGSYRIDNAWIATNRSNPINLNKDFASSTNPLTHPVLDASIYFSPFTNINKSYLPLNATASTIDGPKLDGVYYSGSPLDAHYNSNQNSWFVFNSGTSGEIEVQAISNIINGISYGSMAYPSIRLYDYNGTTFTLLNSTNVIWNKASLSYAGLQPNKDYFISVSNPVDITGNGSFTLRLFREASNDIIQGAYILDGETGCNSNPSTDNPVNSNLDTYLGPFNTYNGNYHGTAIDGDLVRCRNHWFKILPNSICDIELVENGADMMTAALYEWIDNGNGIIDPLELVLIANKTYDEANNFHIDIPDQSKEYLYMVGQSCNGPLKGQFELCVTQCQSILPKETDQGIKQKNVQLVVYPNPNDGQFNIKITDIDSKYLSVQLVDITGKLIQKLMEETQNDLSNVEIMVQKSNLAAGVYFIVTNTDKNSLTKKLIIE